MASVFYNVFSNEEIEYLTQLPEVSAAKDKLNSSNPSSTVYFNVPLNETLRASLTNCFGLDFSNVSEIPMKWIKGDTNPHIDSGSTKFENTYLAYINDSDGEFIIDNDSYPITANTAFKFNEGVLHLTRNTGIEPRLLLGPMNEFVNPVGAPNIYYYDNYADAYAGINYIARGYDYNWELGLLFSGSIGTYTSWRVAQPQGVGATGVYNNGFDLSVFGSTSYNVYPATPCFLEGSKILSLVEGKETFVPIETLQKGDLIKTTRDGYKKIELIGKGNIVNFGNNERIEERLYKCSTEKYPELTEDLYITGFHSILVDTLTEIERENIMNYMGDIYVTDSKYRLIACADERAEPWNSQGNFTIWHIALENKDERMNYGIYANGGLLVESCSINFLKNHANMSVA